MKEIEIAGHIDFTYTNWKGDESRRTVMVEKIVFGESSYHTGMQFLMYAFDEKKNGAMRVFAMKDMSEVSGAFIPFSDVKE